MHLPQFPGCHPQTIPKVKLIHLTLIFIQLEHDGRYILNTLHERHVGLVKMKAMAGSAVWWPSIDQDIGAMTKDCIGCDKQSRNPERIPLHPWEWAWKPWQRVHIEFTGPVGGSMLLVIVDDFSKWPEVVPMGVDITAHKIIEALKILWSRYGLPEILVSDNGLLTC